MHWFFLFLAIGLEVTATAFLKASHGWTRAWPAAAAILFFPSSTIIYSLALKKIPVSTAYAFWSGLGTAAMVFVGWLIFKESITLMKGFFILVILAGILGLRLSS